MSEEKTSPKLSFDTDLHAALARASLISFLVGPVLALLGLSVDEKFLQWLIFVGIALPFVGAGYIYRRYNRHVKGELERTGRAPRPEWLWTLFADRITHDKVELSAKESVMVLAPPGARDRAERLKKVYNPDEEGAKLLLFHCLPAPKPGFGPEQFGETLYDPPVRPLDALPAAMKDCAAVVLLDDATWGDYVKTRGAVVDWSLRNTVRPILSVRVGGGGGSLIYTDCHWEDVVKADKREQPLLSLLLTQADKRAEKWHQQASLRRMLVMRLSVLALSLFLVCVVGAYVGWLQFSRLRHMTSALDSVTRIDSDEQIQLARALADFRQKTTAPPQEPFQKLLEAHAKQFRKMLERSSEHTSALHVILFAVTPAEDGSLSLREVAATRDLRSIKFDVRRGSHIASIVGCAVAERSFILWTGDSSNGWARTDDIEAWDLWGKPVRDTVFPVMVPDGDSETRGLTIGQSTCTYKRWDKNEDRKAMLCAPVGMDEETGKFAGAVCVSAKDGVDERAKGWMLSAVLHFGDSLSFASWEGALLPATPTPTPNKGR